MSKSHDQKINVSSPERLREVIQDAVRMGPQYVSALATMYKDDGGDPKLFEATLKELQ